MKPENKFPMTGLKSEPQSIAVSKHGNTGGGKPCGNIFQIRYKAWNCLNDRTSRGVACAIWTAFTKHFLTGIRRIRYKNPNGRLRADLSGNSIIWNLKMNRAYPDWNPGLHHIAVPRHRDTGGDFNPCMMPGYFSDLICTHPQISRHNVGVRPRAYPCSQGSHRGLPLQYTKKIMNSYLQVWIWSIRNAGKNSDSRRWSHCPW